MNIYSYHHQTQRWLPIAGNCKPNDARKLAQELSHRESRTLYTIGEQAPEEKQPNIFFWQGLELEPKATSLVVEKTHG